MCSAAQAMTDEAHHTCTASPSEQHCLRGVGFHQARKGHFSFSGSPVEVAHVGLLRNCSAWALQERWAKPGAELVSGMHGPAHELGSPMKNPSAVPDGEQKVKRFLAFSTGVSPALCSSALLCLLARAQYKPAAQ